jgi:hypothetical protein
MCHVFHRTQRKKNNSSHTILLFTSNKTICDISIVSLFSFLAVGNNREIYPQKIGECLISNEIRYRNICSKLQILIMKNTNAIVGRSDQNLSSALDSLHVRFAKNNDDDYFLVPENENKKSRKIRRRKSNTTDEFNRQSSTINRKIDQFQVKDLISFSGDFYK